VAGQEVLTADNVGLKLSLVVTYQVVDPVKAAHETQHWQGDLYNAAQLALRAVVSGVAAEALLDQRLEIARNSGLESSGKPRRPASTSSLSK